MPILDRLLPWRKKAASNYDILREEFLALVTALIAELGKFDPAVKYCNPKKALFRINRDVRFAHDKSPYKTRFSAAVTSLTGSTEPGPSPVQVEAHQAARIAGSASTTSSRAAPSFTERAATRSSCNAGTRNPRPGTIRK